MKDWSSSDEEALKDFLEEKDLVDLIFLIEVASLSPKSKSMSLVKKYGQEELTRRTKKS